MIALVILFPIMSSFFSGLLMREFNDAYRADNYKRMGECVVLALANLIITFVMVLLLIAMCS